jgi:hypothetical protein
MCIRIRDDSPCHILEIVGFGRLHFPGLTTVVFVVTPPVILAAPSLMGDLFIGNAVAIFFVHVSL